VDGGLLGFDRDTGRNILIKGRDTAHVHRTAPRVLQIGLLTPCNLHCEFCYRDTGAPSRLTAPFLVDLLAKAANWGVLEVAFGGGEPLMFRGFVEFVEELHRTTPLGINFTTNGTLLTPALLDRLRDGVGEIRVSAYPDNHYRRTLRMARGMNVGVNWLVTPANVGMIEPHVLDFFAQGAKSVLLLGYKGHDPALHLRERDYDILKKAVGRLPHLPLRLDVCWYPRLREVPHLFARADCGAGDEFLVITPDQAVQPCSFHHERIPFESFAELKAVYERLRVRRPTTDTPGCTRAEFRNAPIKNEVGAWFWTARAGNNSGDWTIVGRFREAAQAQKAAEALRELARAHEAFLASPDGNEWLVANDYFGSVPTPPLRKFGEAHGFDWTQPNQGLWWEEDGAGAPVLTAGAVGNTVVVYHPYCMGLPEEPFRNFFAKAGAVDFGYWQYDRPMVVARASGNEPAAVATLEKYLALVSAAEYPDHVKASPPWGEDCTRLFDDEDRNTRLAGKAYRLEQTADRVTLGLYFENTFAGALALEDWLKLHGYTEVTVSIEQPLDSLPPRGDTVEPVANLFGRVIPLRERLAAMSAAEVIEVLFDYHHNMPDALAEAVAAIPADERVRLARAACARRLQQGQDVEYQALHLIGLIGQTAADWMREIWARLASKNSDLLGYAVKTAAASLSKDEAFALARAWLESTSDQAERKSRLQAFGNLHHEGTIQLLEQWWAVAPPGEATIGWGTIAALSEMKWPDIRRWLDSGRPLSLIALNALEQYVANGLPPGYRRPSAQEYDEALEACRIKDPAPRASSAVARLLGHAATLSEG
jgi:hypothetical protein